MKHDERLVKLLRRYPYYKRLYANIVMEINRRKKLDKIGLQIPPDMFCLKIERKSHPVLKEKEDLKDKIRYNQAVYDVFGGRDEYNYGYSNCEVVKRLREKKETVSLLIKQIEGALEMLSKIQLSVINEAVIYKDDEENIEDVADRLYISRYTLYYIRDEALEKLEMLLAHCIE